jgi:hypothetical protein
MRGAALALLVAGCYGPTIEDACSVTCDFAGAAQCPGDLQCFADNVCHDPAAPACPGDGGGTFDANLVFVTSQTYSVGTLGSVAAADAICQSLADARQLPGTYRAWLATTAVPASAQLGNARGWVRPDNRPVVDRVPDLLAGKLLYPPRLDEFGVDHPDGSFAVATGSAPDGSAEFTCSDYTSASGDNGGLMAGRADATTGKWTKDATLPCNATAHLYCFGVDRDVAIVVPPLAGQKRAFVTQSSFTATTGGRGGADTVCDAEARTASLAGTFQAFLATTFASAASRFGEGPWFRVDGVEIGTLVTPIAPLNVTASGAYVTGTAWTGAITPNDLGSAATTCDDWVQFGGTGAQGDVTRSAPGPLFFLGTGNCTTPASIFCLEQ